MGLEEEYESDDSFDLNDLDDHPRSEGQPEPIDQLDTSDLENDGQGYTVFCFPSDILTSGEPMNEDVENLMELSNENEYSEVQKGSSRERKV